MSTASDYEFTRGDSWPFTLDQITDLTGAAVTDVTAWGCRWTMRSITSRLVMATASTGAATISRGSGLFSWIVPKTTTDDIEAGIYSADTEVTDGSGNVQTFHSFITVKEDQSI